MRWVVGDIHGCAREFDRLLTTIRFDPSRDQIWSVGDLLNRGPDSLATLRLWRASGGRGVIGNHEVSALLAHSGRRPRKLPALEELFRAPDADELLAALRALPVLAYLPATGNGPGAWIVHAGLDPRWKRLDRAAARINAGPHDDDWLENRGVRFAVGVRCCAADSARAGLVDLAAGCPRGYRPWNEFYRGPTMIVHGHWAMRGHYRNRRTLGLDSACVHGGWLTAWCQDEDRVVQVRARSHTLS